MHLDLGEGQDEGQDEGRDDEHGPEGGGRGDDEDPSSGGGVDVDWERFEAEFRAYEQRLRVSFVARLRDERRFSGREALIDQIQQDVRSARRVLDGGGDGL